MPKDVFENDSKDFISNIKDTVDVTLATDDNKQLEAHNKDFMVKETMIKKEQLCPIKCLKTTPTTLFAT